jgi:hypothetical protein
VVRYHRPAADKAAFNDNHLVTHLATQAKLPRIRAIMCYMPLDDLPGRAWDSGARVLPAPDYIIGNEVIFDDIDTFNVSMASLVQRELRNHYRAFSAFTGANIHFPMTYMGLFD